MNAKKSDPPYILPNGYTFLAVTASDRGVWAKATDPVTAIQNAHRDAGGKTNAIYVIYGKSDELFVQDNGGWYTWQRSNPPVPIGIFTVTSRSIKPIAKGDFNEDHLDCLGWMTEQLEDIEHLAKS
jgi:hypothetical protein